jgi:uncharacterized protein (DUF2237 family)
VQVKAANAVLQHMDVLEDAAKALDNGNVQVLNTIKNRWKEAFYAGCAPKIKLESTHIKALEFVELDILKLYAV